MSNDNSVPRPLTFLTDEVKVDKYLHKAIVRVKLEGIDKQVLGTDSAIIGYVEIIRAATGGSLEARFQTFSPFEFQEEVELDGEDKVIIFHQLKDPALEEPEFVLTRIFGNGFKPDDTEALAAVAAVEAGRMIQKVTIKDNAEIYSVNFLLENYGNLE